VNGQAGLPAALANELEAAHIPGLRRAWPFTFRRVAVPDLDGAGATLLGVPLEPGQPSDPPARDISIPPTPGPFDRLKPARYSPPARRDRVGAGRQVVGRRRLLGIQDSPGGPRIDPRPGGNGAAGRRRRRARGRGDIPSAGERGTARLSVAAGLRFSDQPL